MNTLNFLNVQGVPKNSQYNENKYLKFFGNRYFVILTRSFFIIYEKKNN